MATKKLSQQLIAKNSATEAIHGDLFQKERDKVMRAFKNESLRVLVATDLAARGIDVSDLAFVAQYQSLKAMNTTRTAVDELLVLANKEFLCVL